jgi:hypothetical protein
LKKVSFSSQSSRFGRIIVFGHEESGEEMAWRAEVAIGDKIELIDSTRPPVLTSIAGIHPFADAYRCTLLPNEFPYDDVHPGAEVWHMSDNR